DVVSGARQIGQVAAAGAVVLDRKDGVRHEEPADPRLARDPGELVDADPRRLLSLGDVRLLLCELVGPVEERVETDHHGREDGERDEGLDERHPADPFALMHRAPSGRATGWSGAAPGTGRSW